MPKLKVKVQVGETEVSFESKKFFTNYMEKRLKLGDLDEKHSSGFTHREIIKNFMLEKLPLLRKSCVTKENPENPPKVLYCYSSEKINLIKNASFGITEILGRRYFSFVSKDIYNLNMIVPGEDGKLYRRRINTFSPKGMMKSIYYKAEEPEERISFSEFYGKLITFHDGQRA